MEAIPSSEENDSDQLLLEVKLKQFNILKQKVIYITILLDFRSKLKLILSNSKSRI